MDEDFDRVIKGYKPKSNKDRYWILYYILEMVAIIRLKFSQMIR